MITPRQALFRVVPWVGLVCMVAGCTTGGLRTDETLTRQPAGIRVDIELSDRQLLGELLEVRPEGLLLLVDQGASAVAVDGPVILLPMVSVPGRFRAGTDRPVGGEGGRLVRMERERDREWLRSFSRFPYGMSADVTARLLATYGQTTVGSLAPAGGNSGSDGPHDVDPAVEPAVTAFLADVTAAAARFAEASDAVRLGYRRVGPDFPGMGQHWVNPGRVLSGGVDPAHPQILTYVDVAGTPTLTGVAFAMPLGEGETLPEEPLPASAWHDHGGSLDEEALILESAHTARHDGAGPRLAMVHAWLWPPNPDGPLAQNNWALSWVRLGLPVPESPEPRLARALSLAGNGAAYYRTLLRRTAGLTRADPTDRSVVTIDSAVERAARRADAVLEGRGTGPLSETERNALRAAWEGLWDDLLAGVDPATGHQLEAAYQEWGGHLDS